MLKEKTEMEARKLKQKAEMEARLQREKLPRKCAEEEERKSAGRPAASDSSDIEAGTEAHAEPRDGKPSESNVCVLIDRHSYSNALAVAAIFQDYGVGEILGEKTSDMATTCGAMATIFLPTTALVVRFPKEPQIIWPSDERKSSGVTPDVLIHSPIASTLSDAVLENFLKQHMQLGGCRKSPNTGRL